MTNPTKPEGEPVGSAEPGAASGIESAESFAYLLRNERHSLEWAARQVAARDASHAETVARLTRELGVQVAETWKAKTERDAVRAKLREAEKLLREDGIEERLHQWRCVYPEKTTCDYPQPDGRDCYEHRRRAFLASLTTEPPAKGPPPRCRPWCGKALACKGNRRCKSLGKIGQPTCWCSEACQLAGKPQRPAARGGEPT